MSHLVLNYAQRERLLALTMQHIPQECCGLIAGTNQTVLEIIPIANVAPDPERHFHMDDMALLKAFKRIEQQNLTLLAMYHSHPMGRAIPSLEDIREAAKHYPGMIQLITATSSAKQPDLRAWQIDADRSVERVTLLLPGQKPEDEPLSIAQRNALLVSGVVAFITLILVSVSLLPPPPPL